MIYLVNYVLYFDEVLCFAYTLLMVFCFRPPFQDSLLKKQAVYGPERKLHVAISLQMEKLLLSARQYKKAVLWNTDTLQTESTLKTDYAYFYERRKKRRLTSDFVVQIRTASPLFERLHRSLANMGTLFVFFRLIVFRFA